MERADLYSQLKVSRDATEDEIHKAYKSLSTSFHPDKLPPTTPPEKREQIQLIFMEFKRANDVLTDPVLRLAYDYYGENGVRLVRRIQQHRREQKKRKEANVDDESDGEDDEMEANLYDKVERLLSTNPLQARAELQRFFEQHDYHQHLTEQNQVQLACSMEFPPVVNLEKLVYQGRDYVKFVQKRTYASTQGASGEDLEYYKQRIKQEQSIVDYQLNRFRESQKSEVGFTLSSTVPARNPDMTGTRVQPKWSMVMGGTTNLVYPDVAKVLELAGKKKGDQKHPTSMFVNAIYQPLPETQINLTANMTNDQSHQFVVGSSRTFSNRSAFRYNMTFLNKSPLDTNLILNLKSYRPIKEFGILSTGISMGGNRQLLQWSSQWEGHRGTANLHKYSAKVSIGMMQGNSLNLTYELRAQKDSWLDEYITIPKLIEASTVISGFPKISGMVTQEFTSLATHPTLGFGMEHDISLGTWTWIWEWTYQNSTFRVPIPVLRLGSISDPSFYTQKMYYGIYSLLVQAMVADLFQDVEEQKKPEMEDVQNPPTKVHKSISESKTKKEAEQQVALMERVAETKRIMESRRDDGLVILRATYWLESQSANGQMPGPVLSMDATRQLQFWVTNGRLSLSSFPKSSRLGFYSLETESQVSAAPKFKWDWRVWRRWMRRNLRRSQQQQPKTPRLTIRYTNGGYVYEITIGETEALVLPSKRAQLLGHASSVE